KCACVSTTAATSSSRRPSWSSAVRRESQERGTPASTTVSRSPSSIRYQFVWASSMRWTPSAALAWSMPSGLPSRARPLSQRPHRLVAVAVVADVLERQRLVVARVAAADRDQRRLLGRAAAAERQPALRQRVLVEDLADVGEVQV